MLIENIKIALRSMINNKMRTLLSLLGIIIGVAAVVAILNLGQSANNSITSSMSQAGIDLVTIYPNQYLSESEIYDEGFGYDIKNNVKGIENVIPVVSSNTLIRSGQNTINASISGVTSNYFEVNSSSFLYGECFSAMDNLNRRQVVILGFDIAEELFPVGNAIGSYISIFRNQAKTYEVIGVLEEQDSMLGASFNNGIFIPYNTYIQRFTKKDIVSSYVVKVENGQNSIDVGDSISNYLDEKVSSSSYNLFSPASIVEMAGEITSTFSTFLATIAAISLLVGGIGIMNIMLVSVAERAREIGIRKALGASPKVIRGQFLCEAITLTLIGGIIGILLGSFISYAIVNVVGWSLQYSYFAIILSLGFSMFVGIFFGWYPAAKASKLDAIESLSYE